MSEQTQPEQSDSRVCRAAYADPPYPGYARYYRDHPDYAGEVDHGALLADLAEFDGWALHTYVNALPEILPLCPEAARIAAWVKPWCSWKPGISPAYAWEPILFVPARSTDDAVKPRDWIACQPAMRTGLKGAKPAPVIRWVFALLGLTPADELVDLYPGTGAVGQAWAAWGGASGVNGVGAARIWPQLTLDRR